MNKKITRVMVAFLAVVMVLMSAMDVSAAGIYSTKDRFKNVSIKGQQGARYSNVFGGLDHTLYNVFLDEAIKSPDSSWAINGWIAPYEFEGENFYFNDAPLNRLYSGGNGVICSDMSVSIVFLLRKQTDEYGCSSNFIIDQGSLADGYPYYAPNADLSTYGGRAVRAFWHYVMDYLTDKGAHIDNFILGNEVNMPNQWHYSGSTDGTGDANNCATKYADAFFYMYNGIRQHSSVPRCSVSLDHSWQNNNEGRGIAAKDFLHIFHNRLAQHGGNVDWCVSTHLYPAQLFDTRIWYDPHNLAPNDSTARIIDGSNLCVMTNYIRDTFGSQHRIMLTEQGFTDQYGPQVQAACLAYTYYAAKYDPMVDNFLITTHDAGEVNTSEGVMSLDFSLEGTLAEQVYTKIDNGNESDRQWIDNTCLPVIGVSSWTEIIPNYGADWAEVPSPEEIANTKAFVERMYTVALGRTATQGDVEYWADRLLSHELTGATLANSFIMSEEFLSKCYQDREYLRVLYGVFLNREPDGGGLDYWLGKMNARTSRKAVLAGFVDSQEFTELCADYGINKGTLNVDMRVVPEGIYSFVGRSYVQALNREGEPGGVAYWVTKIVEKMSTPEDAAKAFFLSQEYLNKNTSNKEYIQSLYKTFMDREAEPAGLEYWMKVLQNGASRESVVEGFAYSNEFKEIMKSFGL